MSIGYGATRKAWGAEVVPLNSSIKARQRMGELANSGKPFTNNGGTVTGEPGRCDSFGWLPREFWPLAEAATYVVYSFATPIAMRGEDGTWVVPPVKYSSRTTKHQSFCRVYLPAN